MSKPFINTTYDGHKHLRVPNTNTYNSFCARCGHLLSEFPSSEIEELSLTMKEIRAMNGWEEPDLRGVVDKMIAQNDGSNVFTSDSSFSRKEEPWQYGGEYDPSGEKDIISEDDQKLLDWLDNVEKQEKAGEGQDIFTWISQSLGLKPRKQNTYGPVEIPDNTPRKQYPLCKPGEIYDPDNHKCIPKYMAPWRIKNWRHESYAKERASGNKFTDMLETMGGNGTLEDIIHAMGDYHNDSSWNAKTDAYEKGWINNTVGVKSYVHLTQKYYDGESHKSNPKMGNIGRIEDIYREMERIVDPDMTGDVNKGYSDQMIRDMSQKHNLSEYQIQEIWDSAGTTDIDVSNEFYSSENENDWIEDDLPNYIKELRNDLRKEGMLISEDDIITNIERKYNINRDIATDYLIDYYKKGGESYSSENENDFDLSDWNPKTLKDKIFGPSILPGADWVTKKITGEELTDDEFKKFRLKQPRHDDEYAMDQVCTKCGLEEYEHENNKLGHDFAMRGNEEIIEQKPYKPVYHYYKQYPLGRRANVKSHFGNEVSIKILREAEQWWERTRVKQGYPQWKDMNIINKQRAITDYAHHGQPGHEAKGKYNKEWWESASTDDKEKALKEVGFGMMARPEGSANSLALRTWEDLPSETKLMFGESYVVSNERFGDFFEFDEGESGERFEGHRFECKICGKVFDEDDDRFGHLKNVHNKSGESYSSIIDILNEADFKEEDHPRDKGKFTSKGGGSSGGKKEPSKKEPRKHPDPRDEGKDFRVSSKGEKHDQTIGGGDIVAFSDPFADGEDERSSRFTVLEDREDRVLIQKIGDDKKYAFPPTSVISKHHLLNANKDSPELEKAMGESYSNIINILNEADFDEEEHPREDDGQFADKGGGGSGGGKDKPSKKEPSKAQKDHTQAMSDYDDEMKRYDEKKKKHEEDTKEYKEKVKISSQVKKKFTKTDEIYMEGITGGQYESGGIDEIVKHMNDRKYGFASKKVTSSDVRKAIDKFEKMGLMGHNKTRNQSGYVTNYHYYASQGYTDMKHGITQPREPDKPTKPVKRKEDISQTKHDQLNRLADRYSKAGGFDIPAERSSKKDNIESQLHTKLDSINKGRDFVKDGHYIVDTDYNRETKKDMGSVRLMQPIKQNLTYPRAPTNDGYSSDYKPSDFKVGSDMVKVGDTIEFSDGDRGRTEVLVSGFDYGGDEWEGPSVSGYVTHSSNTNEHPKYQRKGHGDHRVSDVRRIVSSSNTKMKEGTRESYAKEVSITNYTWDGMGISSRRDLLMDAGIFPEKVFDEHGSMSASIEEYEKLTNANWDGLPEHIRRSLGGESYSKEEKSFSDMNEKELEELGDDESNPKRGLESTCSICSREKDNHWKDNMGVKISHDFKEKANESWKCSKCGKVFGVAGHSGEGERFEHYMEHERAGEGGRGSGKRGHAGWMKAIEEVGDYQECPHCKVMTEQYGGKCQLCGKSVSKENIAVEGTYEAEVYCEKCNTIIDKFDYKDTSEYYQNDVDSEVWKILREHNKKIHPI